MIFKRDDKPSGILKELENQIDGDDDATQAKNSRLQEPFPSISTDSRILVAIEYQ